MKLLFEVGSSRVGGAENVIARLAQGLRAHFPDWQIDVCVCFEAGGLHERYGEVFNNVHHLKGATGHRAEERRNAMLRLIVQHGYNLLHAVDSHESMRLTAQECGDFCPVIQAVFPEIGVSRYAPDMTWLGDARNGYAAIHTEIEKNISLIPVPSRPPHLVRVIRNGIDTDFWTPPQVEKRQIDVLWVGRMEQAKGAETLMHLIQRWPVLRWHVVANESLWMHDIMLSLARETPSVCYEWGLPKEELRERYRTAYIYLHTSLSEGQPGTILEAMACGCLPVAGAVGGLPEMIDDSFGWLVPSIEDPGPQVETYERILGDALQIAWHLPDESAARRATALARIDRDHTLPGMIAAYANLYREVLASREFLRER